MFEDDEEIPPMILTFEEWKLKNPIHMPPQVIQAMIENHIVDIQAELDIILEDRYNQYVDMMSFEDEK